MPLFRKNQTTEAPSPFNPHTATTDELRNFIGNFEKEWDAHIAAAPQFVRYQGSYIAGEIAFMQERGAITVHEEPFRYIKIRPAAYDSFQKQKEAMNILKSRREIARRHELKDRDDPKYHPDPKLFTMDEFDANKALPVIEIPGEEEINVEDLSL